MKTYGLMLILANLLTPFANATLYKGNNRLGECSVRVVLDEASPG